VRLYKIIKQLTSRFRYALHSIVVAPLPAIAHLIPALPVGKQAVSVLGARHPIPSWGRADLRTASPYRPETEEAGSYVLALEVVDARRPSVENTQHSRRTGSPCRRWKRWWGTKRELLGTHLREQQKEREDKSHREGASE